MRFKGRLRLPNDAGEGIPIDLTLEDVYLSLVSDGEDFGEWRLDTVEIRRLFSNQFSLMLDGEEMVYIADDALGFAYDGLSFVEEVTARLGKKRLFKSRRGKKPQTAMVTEPVEVKAEEPGPDVTPEPVGIPAPAPVPLPEPVPFFPETPSIADPAAAASTDIEGVSPVQARPITLGDPAPPVMPAVPAAHAGPPDYPEVSAPPPTAAAPAPTVPETVAPEPVVPTQQEMAPAATLPEYEEEDEELVIEEVTAYRYPTPVSMVPPIETNQPASEPEPQPVVESAPPATPAPRDVPPEAHPLGAPTAPDPAEAPIDPLPAPAVEDAPAAFATPTAPRLADPVSAISNTVEYVPPTSPLPEIGHGSMPAPNGSAPSPVFESPAPLPPAEPPRIEPAPPSVAPATDDATDSRETQRGGRHEKRSEEKQRGSLFGRKKSREPEAHEHRYESSKTVGGITRSICAICGHVSFAGEDVYQNW